MEKEQRFYLYKIILDRLNTFIISDEKISLENLEEPEIINKLIYECCEMHNAALSNVGVFGIGGYALILQSELKIFIDKLHSLIKELDK
jgi:hypothetical protein